MSTVGSSGTFFVFPPHHRLFAVFDDPAVGSEVAAELRDGASAQDVWTFFGDRGIERLDPHDGRHGLPVAVARVLQRVLTNDCEYCEGLSGALRRGAMVLAVRVPEDGVAEISERLVDRGAHSLAYGQHWNFVPVREALHTVGYFPSAQ